MAISLRVESLILFAHDQNDDIITTLFVSPTSLAFTHDQNNFCILKANHNEGSYDHILPFRITNLIIFM